MLRVPVAAVAALAMALSPIAVAAAQPVVVPDSRAGAAADDASALAGGPWLPPLLFATIVVLGVLTATGVLFDDDGDTPVSP
jgi:hypothetical protein